jgi:putative ABC transport system ATP-binding protein
MGKAMTPDGSRETSPTEELVLVCRGVTKTFGLNGRQVRVLAGIDLSVRRGEVVVISGRTGSGKSTLLMILAGLDRPTSGSVAVDGSALEGMSGGDLARLRRRKIGIVFQSFNLLPSWTAVENVEAALLHAGLSKAARRDTAAALLRELGLADRLGHLPSELSVGQQQCVAIARALANQPAILVADEPTGDVDPETAETILGHLMPAARQRGAALIVATHGTFPLDVVARRFRMEDGRLVPQDPRG